MENGYAFETWKRFIGPTSYAFQCAGATFILLNNVDYLERSRMEGGCSYRGLFGDKQQRFVANVLRHVPPDQLVVVSMRDRRKRANAHSPPDSLNWLRCIPKAQKYQMSALWSRLG